jgi:hypothetical protein
MNPPILVLSVINSKLIGAVAQKEGTGTQEAQETQEKEKGCSFLVSLVLLVFRFSVLSPDFFLRELLRSGIERMDCHQRHQRMHTEIDKPRDKVTHFSGTVYSLISAIRAGV